MRRLFQVLVFTLLAVAATDATAQERNVRNIFFDTLRSGDIRSTPVGVEEMTYVGTDYISGYDSTLMRYITAVVQFDVDFYADFDLVLTDSFFLKLYEIDELDLLGWKRLGATYLVRLEAEFPGSMIRARWRLWDTSRKQQFAKGRIERPRDEWRDMGHEIADEIVHTLTGEPGIFRTRIVYAREVGQAKELFLAGFDGANERQLTSNGSINLSPVMSPISNDVYFISYLDGDPHLYRVDINTLKVSKVAEYPGIIAAPAISPDGRKIACVLSRDGNSEIYVLDTDGNIIKRLTNHWAIDTSPTWSPDGSMLAFASDRSGAPQVYTMDSDGLGVRRLTYQSSYSDSPIWSARGGRITFVSRTPSRRFDLASIDTSGGDYRVLTEVGMNENPHFSPDGKHVIFSSTRLGSRSIFTMDLTGRNQRRLTREGVCSNPNWGPLP
ncbi:MAG: Tol-Pal system beta propeller repeat protein TolB [candidate division Zixibacteria bacterium]|nr:Tol-Pal system beta propeller repeat protein TolB [candidate division Zixibacteria bacterium]